MTKREAFVRFNNVKMYTAGRPSEIYGILLSIGYNPAVIQTESRILASPFMYVKDGSIHIGLNMNQFSSTTELQEIPASTILGISIHHEKDGDFIYHRYCGCEYVWIYKSKVNEDFVSYHAMFVADTGEILIDGACGSHYDGASIATPAQKLMLIEALHKEGFKWDEESNSIIEVAKKKEWSPQPFEKVLVRYCDTTEWRADFYSHERIGIQYSNTTIGGAYGQCIPYLGNEKLLGTTNSPDE